MSHGVQTVRTPKKRAIVLQALANGAPEARLTQHARAALQRLVPSP